MRGDIPRAIIMSWAGLGPLLLGSCREGNVYILARPEQIKSSLRFWPQMAKTECLGIYVFGIPGCIPCRLHAEDTPIFTIVTTVFAKSTPKIFGVECMECSLVGIVLTLKAS